MTSAFFAFMLLAAVQVPIDLTAVTLPPDSEVNLPLVPLGEVRLSSEATLTQLRIRVGRTDVLSASGPTLPAFVVWAVSPEGEFQNLGELEIDGDRAELETATTWQRLGILITAEPHYLVDTPNSTVSLKSGPPRNQEFRIETITLQLPQQDYPSLSAPPPGTPSRIAQARLAFSLADRSRAPDLAPAELRAARVALNSMEELYGRNLSEELLLPYVNDAIRLGDLAVRRARARIPEVELEAALRRSSQLERELSDARLETTALTQRQGEAEIRRAEILAELQEVAEQNRSYRLENDNLVRRLRTAEADIEVLSDSWPGLRSALSRLGARETARGMLVTMPGDLIGEDSELDTAATHLLERLVGVLALGDLPDIRVEGHAIRAETEAESLAESTEMAVTVANYLIAGGIPSDRIRTQGMGSARPIAGATEAGEESLNRRVEITFRQASGQ